MQKKMKVLMFGWEFPPFISGGLGTACHGLTKGLNEQGVDVTFVLPKAFGAAGESHVKIVFADQKINSFKREDVRTKVVEVNSLLRGYMTPDSYEKTFQYSCDSSSLEEGAGGKAFSQGHYGSNLYLEVYRYAEFAGGVAEGEDHDIIHAHDWLTYPAAIKAKQISGKPLVVHIHNTVFDRYGELANSHEYQIEREGFMQADVILAVSEWTRQKVINHYNIQPEKVKVVHNSVDFLGSLNEDNEFSIEKEDKVVLSLGRLTHQKGLLHLVWAAKKAVSVDPGIKFIIGGTGDLKEKLEQEVYSLNLQENVKFIGWLNGDDITRAYKSADLFVMPSISEPFGLTPLESLRTGTPVLISKQSGVSEVLNNCLKVDFWDIDQMANKIVSTVNLPCLRETMREEGQREVMNLSWSIPAEKCAAVYNVLVGNALVDSSDLVDGEVLR